MTGWGLYSGLVNIKKMLTENVGIGHDKMYDVCVVCDIDLVGTVYGYSSTALYKFKLN